MVSWSLESSYENSDNDNDDDDDDAPNGVLELGKFLRKQRQR